MNIRHEWQLRCTAVKHFRAYSSRTPAPRPILARYAVTTRDLFRIQPRTRCELRDRAKMLKKGKTDYDVILGSDGLVHPNNEPMSKGRNGASCRGMCVPLQDQVEQMPGDYPIIYRLPKGTALPPSLIVLREDRSQYSIQPRHKMTLSELAWEITSLLRRKAELISKEDFMDRYVEVREGPANEGDQRYREQSNQEEDDAWMEAYRG